MYKKCSNNVFGRSNPEYLLGLYCIRREIRHTLQNKGENETIDIDVKNCHPTLLFQILEHNSLISMCPLLHQYVENRELFFTHIKENYGVGDEEAKKLIIIYTYGGSLRRWIEKNKIIKSGVKPELIIIKWEIIETELLLAFKSEQNHIHGIIASHNPTLVSIANKN